MKFLKILIVLAVGTVSLLAAVYFTERYVLKAETREEALAEAIIKGKFEAGLHNAEEQAENELKEQGKALAAENMKIKLSETTSAIAITTAVKDESEIVISESDGIITEFTRGGLLPADRTGIPVRTMFGLSADEQKKVIDFLIDHYFLNGYKYSREEIRPEQKEKKKLGAEMESGVIDTLNIVMNSIDMSDVSTIMGVDYGAIANETKAIRDEFSEKYKNVNEYGDVFGTLYEASMKYYDRLIVAFGKLEKVVLEYNNASNPLLAIGLITSSLNDVIIPEIMAVLEQSFYLIETSHEIFLEGTQGTILLTRDEVKDIIMNPALVLNTGV